jgi:hypothetical protein
MANQWHSSQVQHRLWRQLPTQIQRLYINLEKLNSAVHKLLTLFRNMEFCCHFTLPNAKKYGYPERDGELQENTTLYHRLFWVVKYIKSDLKTPSHRRHEWSSCHSKNYTQANNWRTITSVQKQTFHEALHAVVGQGGGPVLQVTVKELLMQIWHHLMKGLAITVIYNMYSELFPGGQSDQNMKLTSVQPENTVPFSSAHHTHQQLVRHRQPYLDMNHKWRSLLELDRK